MTSPAGQRSFVTVLYRGCLATAQNSDLTDTISQKQAFLTKRKCIKNAYRVHKNRGPDRGGYVHRWSPGACKCLIYTGKEDRKALVGALCTICWYIMNDWEVLLKRVDIRDGARVFIICRIVAKPQSQHNNRQRTQSKHNWHIMIVTEQSLDPETLDNYSVILPSMTFTHKIQIQYNMSPRGQW